MAESKPDFGRLKKVLLRDGEPDIVPFFEFYPVKNYLTMLEECRKKGVYPNSR